MSGRIRKARFSVGHNFGCIDEPGKGVSTHVWAKASCDLISKFIIELFRLQLASVKGLGLGFKIYVGFLTVSGCDFVRLVF
jgi:hypothetical protein